MSERDMRPSLSVRAVAMLSLALAALILSGCAFNRAFIPEVHKVQQGESLSSIAAEYDLNWRKLARWNGIEPPYNIHVGQRLTLDPFPPLNYDRMQQLRRQHAQLPRQQSQSSRSSQSSGRATVTALPADQGPSVAQLSDTQTQMQQHASGAGTQTSGPTATAVGEQGASGQARETTRASSAVAGGASASGSVSAQQGTTVAIGNYPSSQQGQHNNRQRPQQSEHTQQASPSELAPPPLVSEAGWRWPLATSVLDSHTPQTTRHGINLPGVKGTPVYAARAGQVVYSGVGLQGFGQLVIIKHDNNYLSAYGYVRNVQVREGERINAGEHIADMGVGPGSQAMLHFEIRHNGDPIEPESVLPDR